ncbi:hypothetical protein A8924_4146 [Saccharopolyspora erythraea NRRL 2338]|uniref:Uncharacterized protein n=1 Tax=Saccharopolyspora erythraea TaxID=1836 RepID=A0ABN1CIB8_SACER|nr:hypothetical protein N599_35065 [Saccharopolyspora erythraea D]PFG96735.1 hypothetical protein A8924_4146 [Saccharopolyspora erythraea NRRL 2338]
MQSATRSRRIRHPVDRGAGATADQLDQRLEAHSAERGCPSEPAPALLSGLAEEADSAGAKSHILITGSHFSGGTATNLLFCYRLWFQC